MEDGCKSKQVGVTTCNITTNYLIFYYIFFLPSMYLSSFSLPVIELANYVFPFPRSADPCLHSLHISGGAATETARRFGYVGLVWLARQPRVQDRFGECPDGLSGCDRWGGGSKSIGRLIWSYVRTCSQGFAHYGTSLSPGASGERVVECC